MALIPILITFSNCLPLGIESNYTICRHIPPIGFNRLTWLYSRRLKQRIGTIYNQLGDRFIDISPSMTVRELENECEKLFGICLQVYRRSGNLWLETTMTENWTISHQNKSGSEISARF